MRSPKLSIDRFSIENLRVPEDVRVLGTVARAKAERRRQQFVQVPLWWIDALRSAHYTSTYRVALYLLYRHWKDHGRNPIPVSNVALASVGVSRREKWRALAELERFALIEIARRPRKVPLAKIRTSQS